MTETHLDARCMKHPKLCLLIILNFVLLKTFSFLIVFTRESPQYLNASSSKASIARSSSTELQSILQTTSMEATELSSNSTTTERRDRTIMKQIELQSTSNVTVLSAPTPSLSIELRRNTTSTGSTPISLTHQIDSYFAGISNGTEIEWFHTYLHWHHQVRTEYPDTELFDNATAPKIVIFYFDPDAHKNGLADRMRSLGHMVQFAFKENRLLLLKWYDAPLPLESFLVPHLMNFTVPDHHTTTRPYLLNSTYVAGSVKESQPDRVIYLSFEISTVFADRYGIYWHALFRPSNAVQKGIDNAMRAMNLVPGEFDATHLRVSHPAFRQQNYAEYIKTNGIGLDEGNQYKFAGRDRTIALRGAVRAIKCTEWIAQEHGFLQENQTSAQKIFFYGDSPDLVKMVVNQSSSLADPNKDETKYIDELRTLRSNIEIVGRRDVQVAHLQNRNETSIDAFLSTFVDLYIASYARCIGLGVGRFAFIAGKISGTTCWIRHQPDHRMKGKKKTINL